MFSRKSRTALQSSRRRKDPSRKHCSFKTQGMLSIFVESPHDGTSKQTFIFHEKSTFKDLKGTVAVHFKKDALTLQLCLGSELLSLPESVPVDAVLKEGDTLSIRESLEQASKPKPQSLVHLNGGYSEEEALQLLLSKNEDDSPIFQSEPGVWAKIDNDPELEQIDIDEEEFAQLFQAELTPNQPTNKSLVGSSAKRKGAAVRVIESKRANNGGIILARLKMTHDEMADAVDRIDENAMTAEQMDHIIEYLPTKEERKALEAYMLEGDQDAADKFDGLCECEKFMVAMMTVKHAKRKVRALLFKLQFEGCLDSLDQDVNTVESACDELKNSDRLRKLLGIVLNIGNRLNTAGATGKRKAGAFSLKSLLKLSQAKAFDKKTTFLQYVVLVVQRNNEVLLDFKDDIPTALKADKVYWDQCLSDLEDVENQLENVRRMAFYQARLAQMYQLQKKNKPKSDEDDGSLSDASVTLEEEVEALRASAIGLFTLGAIKKVSTLRDKVEATKVKFAKLLEYFGEEHRRDMQPHDLFDSITTFSRDFDKAKETVLAEVKKKKREERKRQGKKISGSPTVASRHDHDGELLCTGSISQYATKGGISACASICLFAAYRLLNSGPVESTKGSDLDEIVLEGVCKHRELGVGHTDIEDLWNLSQFYEIRCSLELHEGHQGRLASTPDSNGFFAVLQRALVSAPSPQVALLITKSPETILCITTPGSTYLFDSHGQSHESEKRVYLKRFSSLKALANALLMKYPFQDVGDEQSILGDLYNTFEVHPLTVPLFGIAGKAEGVETSKNVREDGFDEASIQQAIRLSLSSQEPGGSAYDVSSSGDCKPPAVDQTNRTTHTGNAATGGSSSTLNYFERDDYEGPISKEIMADPVKCKDGFTYERQNIERYFRTRLEEEERRQAENQGGEQQESNDTCCGARRRIELMSPITGEVIPDDTLLADKNLERTIVRLMESNAFNLSDEEIQEWTELREEKRVRDREREQELSAIRANELRMEEQAILAEERRRAERENTTTTPEVPSANENNISPSEQVRVDRNVRVVSQKLADHDLGLSVALGDEGDKILQGYLTASSGQLRCTVACCASPVHSELPSWCSRCQRIVCEECLNFGVTDIAVSRSTHLHKICAECVAQVLECMDLSELQSRQTRDTIRRIDLQQHFARLANVAADAQDQIVRHETNEAYRLRLEERRQEIQSLQSRCVSLEEQIQRAVNEASQDRRDEGVDSGLDISSRNIPLEDIEVTHEVSLEELNRQYLALLNSRPPEDDEAAQTQYYLSLSELVSRLESEQLRLVQDVSTQDTILAPCTGRAVSEALSILLDSLERLGRRRFLRKHTGRARKSDVRDLRQFISRIGEKEMDGTAHSESYRRLVGELRDHIDQLPPQCAEICSAEIRDAKIELDRKERESFAMTADPLQELLRLQMVNVSSLDEEEQVEHMIRMSELQKRMKRLEDALLGNYTTEHVDGNAMSIDHRSSERRVPIAIDDDINTAIPPPYEDRSAPRQQVSEEAVHAPQSSDNNTETSSIYGLSTLLRGIGSLLGSLYYPAATQSSETPVDLEECQARIEAIGKWETEWRLPLGLAYPTESMEQRLEILQNTLELRLVDSQRHWDQECSREEETLLEELHDLEDTVQDLVAQANNAEAAAAQERAQLEQRRRQRAMERQQEEARRREEERRRQEQVRRAQAEARALQERQEAQTRQAFAAARGGRNQARTFGGSGDLRMCRRCKAGPFENQACSNLATHNGRNHANHCPNCGWHDPNWHNWPYFDGIHGPH